MNVTILRQMNVIPTRYAPTLKDHMSVAARVNILETVETAQVYCRLAVVHPYSVVMLITNLRSSTCYL